MKESLISLAEKKQLPLHQFMDNETLLWIKKNKPSFKIKTNVILPKRDLIKRFIPDNGWFQNKKSLDSIHGIRHLLRVGINAVTVARWFSFKGKIQNLIIAAVLHDIRCRDDKGDVLHGLRAAKWFRGHRRLINKKFKIELSKNDIEEIYWSIVFHELPISEVKKDTHYSRFQHNVDIMRIADALDRYRLPKMKWWINDEILGVTVPERIKRGAYNTIIMSEERFLKGRTSQWSVLSCIK
jgi:hypothetical protein